MGGVGVLLADTSALRPHSLQGNDLFDAGLQRLAAVIPRVPLLTSLDVQAVGGTDVCMFDLLKALVQLQVRAARGLDARPEAPGTNRLRQLNISQNTISTQHVGELAGLLSQLQALEDLNIASAHLPAAELPAGGGAVVGGAATAAPPAVVRACGASG